MATQFPPLPDRSLKRARNEATFRFFVQSKENFPKYHVIHSEKLEKSVRTISPFLVSKCLADTIGPGYKASKLASGDLLLEVCDKVQHSKLPNLVTFGDTPITITPHRSMNTARGVVSEQDLLELSETELLEGWKEQSVIKVERIKIRRDDKEIPTKHLILTFDGTYLPEFIETGYVKLRVRPYVPNPRRCFKCQRFGHGSQSCRGRLTCAKCGLNDHAADNCASDPHCINCEGGHPAYSRSCPTWKKEKQIITLKVTQNISFAEARKRFFIGQNDTYADVVREGAAPRRSAPSARPTRLGLLAEAPAPAAVVGKTTTAYLQQSSTTSGPLSQKASPGQARPEAQTASLQGQASSASQEAMDTTSVPMAPKEKRGPFDRAKKEKQKITGPDKDP